ncbi:hypothetical protein JD969_02070 [Planctomycetota bacterium]|nr:hypothetical protein JD969_02070 [Planctomycetota bacterium]
MANEQQIKEGAAASSEDVNEASVGVNQEAEGTGKPKQKPIRAYTLMVGAMFMLVCALLSLAMAQATIVDQRYGLEQLALTYTEGSMTFVHTMLMMPALIFGGIGVALLVMGSARAGIWGKETWKLVETQHEMTERLDEVSDRLLLSETAKKIAYRRHDIEALRKTIAGDIAEKRFDAALAMVSEMSNTYGYVEESENFRDQIHAARRAEMESRITVAITEIESTIDRNDYEKAMQDAQKLTRLYPESERAKSMTVRVREAREDYKQQVEREFLVAAGKDDVNRAMDLLKVLDVYLTPSEAEPLREVARGVIGKLRDNLGVQFKMAVHEQEWRKAVRVGEQLMAEFPNTRMAAEVRGLIDELRKRIAEMQTQAAY